MDGEDSSSTMVQAQGTVSFLSMELDGLSIKSCSLHSRGTRRQISVRTCSSNRVGEASDPNKLQHIT